MSKRPSRRHEAHPAPLQQNGESPSETARKHEERIARALGGTTVPASGALGAPGNVRTEHLLVSCKETELRTCSLKLSEIEKIDREAVEEEKTPVMAFNLRALEDGVERDWVLIPLRVFVGLLAGHPPG